MSLTDKRWAKLAQEREFTQLDAVRKLAESWRTGLAGATGLFAVATVVKGPDSIIALQPPFRYAVVAAVGIAFGALFVATLVAVRSASGAPTSSLLLTGENLREWSRDEVVKIQKRIEIAIRLVVASVVLLAVAIGTTWLAPRTAETPTVAVRSANLDVCGTLIAVDARHVELDVDPGPATASLRINVPDLRQLVPAPCAAPGPAGFQNVAHAAEQR